MSHWQDNPSFLWRINKSSYEGMLPFFHVIILPRFRPRNVAMPAIPRALSSPGALERINASKIMSKYVKILPLIYNKIILESQNRLYRVIFLTYKTLKQHHLPQGNIYARTIRINPRRKAARLDETESRIICNYCEKNAPHKEIHCLPPHF